MNKFKKHNKKNIMNRTTKLSVLFLFCVLANSHSKNNHPNHYHSKTKIPVFLPQNIEKGQKENSYSYSGLGGFGPHWIL
jgi:hypothetical protein